MERTIQLTTPQEALALTLFEIGAIKFGAFRLKHHENDPMAPLSPIYFNLRNSDNPKPGPLTAEIVATIGQLLYEYSRERGLNYDFVMGVPNAGDPLAAAFAKAEQADLGSSAAATLLKMQKGAEGELGEIMTGKLKIASNNILLIDDLITKAGSKLEAIEAVKTKGGLVKDVLVLIDRQQGGREQLEQSGYRVHSLYSLKALLGFYVTHGCIDQSKADEVLAYVAANNS